MINYSDAILKLRPEATFSIVANDYSTLQWYDQIQTKPTEEEIIDKLAELEEESTKNLYKLKRQFEYPSIGDQLDDLYHAGLFSEEMMEKIKEIKDRYPKPQ